MAWIEGAVCLPDHTAQETAAVLAKLLEPITCKHKIGAGLAPYVTLLHHGHPRSPALERVVERFNVTKAQFVAIAFAPHYVRKADYCAVVLEFESDVFCEFAAQLCAAVEEETNEASVQHRFTPHITLASFESPAQMAKEAPAIKASFAHFDNMKMLLEDFKLMTDE